MKRLQPGDRVAYTAKFLKNTGQFTGPAGERRGTFLAHQDGMFCNVRWDDTDLAALAQKWGADYAVEVAANGNTVATSNIAKVGSPRFALNDL